MTCRACTGPLADHEQTCAACGAPRYVVDPFLEVISGPADGFSVNLPRGEIVLGSGSGANVIIDVREPAAARIEPQHARVIREPTGCWIEPVGGAVAVDARRISGRVRLAHGSLISLGTTTLVCYLPEATT